MKKTILGLIAVSVLLLAGCAVQTPDLEETAVEAVNISENSAETDDGEQIPELVEEFNGEQEKLIIKISPILQYEDNTASKPLVNNILSKISSFNRKVKELEETLDEIEALEFENKREFVSVNREFFRIIKDISDNYTKLYQWERDLMEQSALEKDDKLEELFGAIINCRCDMLDCNSYKDSSMKFMQSSIDIFRKVRDNYGLESYDKVVEMWTKEKEISEKHLPALIQKSKTYSARNCYKMDEYFAKFMNDLDKVDEVLVDEIMDSVSEKWMVSLTNLISEMDELVMDIDSVRAGMEE